MSRYITQDFGYFMDGNSALSPTTLLSYDRLARQTDETNYHIQPSYVTNCTSQSRDLLLFTLLPRTRRGFCREYLPTYIQLCFPEFTIYVLRLNYMIRGESLQRFCLLDFLYFEYQTDKRISENFTLSSSLMCIEPADLGMMTMEQM